ncbi:pilus assembly protein PilM [Caloramator sp. CAR-1]|uniref:pilus assembly protein PilM n=1 Tax=Caloramator sp. CAR-1 TaxID=3062777 RepID=UPI0026E39A4A|nr:pilus assembly protein PilM [Caloramator sp. CAR-1]MDO6354209.1 pilus assembly protein PilM [Caloramator sp. CAR-1]
MFEKVCVEISNNYIKVIEVKMGKKVNIKRVGEISFDVGINKSVLDLDETEVCEKLNKFFSENKLTKKRLNIILSGVSNLLVREIVIPIIKQDKIYDLLKFEASQHIPVDLEKYIIDYKLINTFKEHKIKKQRILVFALPKKMIEKIISISNKLNIKINKIDIEPNVIARLLSKSMGQSIEMAPNNISMIVNLQRSFLTAVIVKDNVIQMTKTFPFDLIDMYKNKEKEDFVPDQYTFNEALENITKLLEFYIAKERTDINSIILIGELAKYFNVSLLLQQKTGVKTQVLENLQFIDNLSQSYDLNSFIVPIAGLL